METRNQPPFRLPPHWTLRFSGLTLQCSAASCQPVTVAPVGRAPAHATDFRGGLRGLALQVLGDPDRVDEQLSIIPGELRRLGKPVGSHERRRCGGERSDRPVTIRVMPAPPSRSGRIRFLAGASSRRASRRSRLCPGPRSSLGWHWNASSSTSRLKNGSKGRTPRGEQPSQYIATQASPRVRAASSLSGRWSRARAARWRRTQSRYSASTSGRTHSGRSRAGIRGRRIAS